MKKKKTKNKRQAILVISDYHAPYNHPDAPKFLAAVKHKYGINKVICIGDEADHHAINFHDHDPDLDSHGTELDKAVESLKKLYKLFPNVTIIESNHGSMVYRRALASGLSKKVIRTYNEILQAPVGWKWVFDCKVETPLGVVYFCHGKSGAAGALAKSYGMSCVQGHYHEKAQITYISTPEKLMFDAHTGCLADDNSLALGYNKINPKRPIMSVIIILDGIPQIIPMFVNHKRWVGSL